MSTTEPISGSLIERAIQDSGYRWMKDPDGDYNVRFGPDDERAVALSCWFILGGSNKTILEFRAWTDKRYQRDDWGKVMFACNTWNREKRWPKAYLSTPDPSSNDPGSISLEWDVALDQGVTHEQLSDWIGNMFSAAHGFWSWATKEQDL